MEEERVRGSRVENAVLHEKTKNEHENPVLYIENLGYLM